MRTITFYCLFITTALSLLSATGCKKESTGGPASIMDNATEYTGTYPATTTVTYTFQGNPVTVTGYPRQAIVFFNMPAAEKDATQLITDNGGTVLEQVPAVGYYMVSTGAIQVNQFCNALRAKAWVAEAMPNLPAYPKSGVAVLDKCGYDHGDSVTLTLQGCGGSLGKCTTITESGTSYVAPLSKQIRAILAEANSNKGGTTLINLSFNGGLDIPDYDFASLSPSKKEEAKWGWYVNMQGILMTIAALPAEYRQNLVITIAAGNENMPIDDLLATLRTRDRIADVLEKNVLLVSTENIQGTHANYAYDDPDVVVVNNSTAYQGTSLATPCAMGWLQQVMSQTGVSASEALKAIKLASWAQPKREVTLPNAVSSINGKTYAGGPYNLVGYENSVFNCVQKYDFTFHEIAVVWNGTSGFIRIPTHVSLTPYSGCTGPGGSADTIMTGNLMMYQGNIFGYAKGGFTFTNGGGYSYPLTFEFKGNLNQSGNVAGTLTCHWNPGFTETLTVELPKQ